MPVMTDEGAETVADAIVVGEADGALEATIETAEAPVTAEEIDESLIFTPAAKPAGRRWVVPAAAGVGAAFEVA